MTRAEAHAVTVAWSWTMDPERRVKACTDQGRWFVHAPPIGTPPRPPGEALPLPRAA